MSAALSKLIREELVSKDGIRKHAPTRRAMTLYSAEASSESLFFVEAGFVKIMRRAEDRKEVLISIIPPGQLFGEQALYDSGPRTVTAEVMQEGVIYEIPRDVFLAFCQSHPEMWMYLSEMLVRRERELERKISLLCLNDVETRILQYLIDLASTFGVTVHDGHEYALPLSQSELASLIGATRETTSTTLNTLARRGLLRLGRRLLVVNSSEAVRAAVEQRATRAQTTNG